MLIEANIIEIKHCSQWYKNCRKDIFFEKKGEETCESWNESSPVWSSTGETHRSKDCNGNVNDGPRNEGHKDIGKNILGL